MKTKCSKKVYILCLSIIVICCMAILGIQSFATKNVFAKEDVALSVQLKETYVRKEKLVIPSANVKVNGENKPMKHTLIYPNGNKSTSSEVSLTQLGEYTLRYTYGDTSVDYNFNVENGMSSLFSATENVLIQNNVHTPDYFVPQTDYAASIDKGVKFTVQGGSSATIYYDNIIDLNELGFSKYDNLKMLEKCFLEWLITPNDNTSKEFSKMEFILTDIYDENNYIYIEMVAGDTQSVYPGCGYVRTSACERYKPLGWLIGSEVLNAAGTGIGSSFYGVSGKDEPSTGRLYFDNKNLELWGGPTNYGFSLRNLRIMDAYDNPEIVGPNNVWNGFTTGEVYLKINVDNIHLSNASFMILNVAGNNMNVDYNETDNVSINLDYGSYGVNKDQYIVAGEGMTFPVFDAIAYSNTTGVIDGIETNVYFGENKQNSIPVVNGKFAVENVGTYYIEYVLDSQFGYFYKEISLTAKNAYDTLDQLSYTPNANIPTTANCGDLVYIEDGVITGGIGKTRCDYVVTCKNGTNTSNVEIVKSGKLPYFNVDKAGTYTIKFIVTDVNNGKVEETLDIVVNEDSVPNIKIPNFPSAFINGLSYNLPKATATYFKNGVMNEIEVVTLVNNVDYTNTLYNVDNNFSIVYKATLPNNVSIFATKTVNCNVINAKTGNDYLKTFFTAESGSVSLDETSLIMTASNASNEFGFLNKIYDGSLNLKFSAYYNSSNEYINNDYSAITVTLTDSINTAQQVKMSVRKEVINGKDYSSFYLNDEFCNFIAGSFDGSSKDVFVFDFIKNTNIVKDLKGTNLATIKNYLNGNAFEGFTSSYVYITIKLENAQNGSKCRLLSIGTQKFSSRITHDNAGPTIELSKTLSTYNTTAYNQNFILPSAKAYDVLSDIKSLKANVKDPSGATIFDGDITQGSSLFINKYGRYVVKYDAVDTNNNSTTMTFYVFAQDYNAPAVTINSGYSVNAYTYDNYSIASITVTDANSYDVVTYAISPDYEQIIINNGKIVFEKEGKYKICYYVYDEFYNFTLVSYVVEVSK